MLSKDDPWYEMAIEKQFQPLVKEEFEEFELPSTLAYLDQETRALQQEIRSDERISYNLHVPSFQRMGMTYEYLLSNLSIRRYASALMTVLWDGMEMTWEEMMGETLDEPGQLLSEADGFGYTLIGM